MKIRIVRLLAILALSTSTILAPVGAALAAPDWTCGSVTVTKLDLSTRKVTVQLSHSTDPTEKIDLNWGDGSALLVVHPKNGAFLSDTQSHFYASAAGSGPFVITMRVFNPDGSASHDCSTKVELNGCYGDATKLTVSTMDAHKTVTATVSYSGHAVIDWGDGNKQTLAPTNQTNLLVSHTYAAAGAYTIQLLVTDNYGNSTGACSRLTTNTASDVTLSSMTAQPAAAGIDWTALVFGLLGVVVLGQVAAFAVIRRR